MERQPGLHGELRMRLATHIVRVLLVVSLLGGVALLALSWQPKLPLATPPLPDAASSEALEQGKELAALGNCAECHTRPGRQNLAGVCLFQHPLAQSTQPT
jgi:cytochrome c553